MTAVSGRDFTQANSESAAYLCTSSATHLPGTEAVQPAADSERRDFPN